MHTLIRARVTTLLLLLLRSTCVHFSECVCSAGGWGISLPGISPMKCNIFQAEKHSRAHALARKYTNYGVDVCWLINDLQWLKLISRMYWIWTGFPKRPFRNHKQKHGNRVGHRIDEKECIGGSWNCTVLWYLWQWITGCQYYNPDIKTPQTNNTFRLFPLKFSEPKSLSWFSRMHSIGFYLFHASVTVHFMTFTDRWCRLQVKQAPARGKQVSPATESNCV